MAETQETENNFSGADIRWTPMVTVSIILHLIAFLFIIYTPGSRPSGREIRSVVYQVNIVELPESALKAQTSAAPPARKISDTQAKKISTQQQKETPRSIAKREADKKSQPEKPDVSSSDLIDSAISKMERKVTPKREDKDHLNDAISRLENQPAVADSRSSGKGATAESIQEAILAGEVENWVKSNWSYPVAADSRRRPEAVVILRVRRDGTVMDSQFKKRSGETMFDQSVMRAIERSDPLPRFPEGYRKNYEEFEITFRLEDFN